MILALTDATATVGAAFVAASAAVIGPIVLVFVSNRTKRTVLVEAESIREQNTEQHGEGQALVEKVAGSLIDLHHKVDDNTAKLDDLIHRVEILEER